MDIISSTGSPVISNESQVRQAYDKRSRFEKTIDFFLSLDNEAAAYCKLFGNMLIDGTRFSHFKYDKTEDLKQWQAQSKGLYIFVHGFKGHPSIFNSELLELEQQQKDKPEYDLYVPYLPNGGCCSIFDAASEVYIGIKDYIQRNPGKPVVLTGFSLGSPVTTIIELRLRKEFPTTPLMIATIAAPHFGSKAISDLEKIGWDVCVLNPVTRDELGYGSDTLHELLEKTVEPLAPGVIRKRVFFATTEDQLMKSLNTSVPQIDRDQIVIVKHGEGHNSLADAVAPDLMNIAKAFMASNQKQKKD